ncbi:MAG: hypothetical protein UX77_C0006G0017 [Parcubacteria group bacterium GW2011_GWA1_47_11]|nr:MAG: hypothetical protein UX77_C0006G0017 [Parcubacteria group bacterium GW2011_GWA1_47_11]
MLNIGIVGSGFGSVGLLPAFKSVKGCKVVSVCTNRSQWPALLERADLDAVAIAVPPQAQYRIAKAAIKKGLHVFAEKPLTATSAQARELCVLARKKNITHGIDFIFPEIAEWKKVKSLLDSKKFGKLIHVSVQWKWQSRDSRLKKWSWRTKIKEGGGALSFYFSHGLYYLEHFAGKIIDAEVLFLYAKGNPYDGESGFDLNLKFKKGITGSICLSSDSRGQARHTLVFTCECGVIVLENKGAVVDNFIVKTYSAAGEKRVRVPKDKQLKKEDERVKIVRILAKRFVRACMRRQQMVPSFAEGLRIQELIDRIRA